MFAYPAMPVTIRNTGIRPMNVVAVEEEEEGLCVVRCASCVQPVDRPGDRIPKRTPSGSVAVIINIKSLGITISNIQISAAGKSGGIIIL